MRREARYSQWGVKKSLSFDKERIILHTLRPSLSFATGVASLVSMWNSTENSVGRKYK